jgi:DNA-binding CsgD family transcriptional regulator
MFATAQRPSMTTVYSPGVGLPLFVAAASRAVRGRSASPGARAPGRSRPRSPDLLDLLSSGSPAAFASDQNHRIIFWNQGAERVMERTAGQALGRLCHEIFAGRDLFGNRFCSESCPVSQTINRHEALNRFEMRTGDQRRPQVLGVSVVEIPDPRRGFHTAVHILDQIEEKSWLARELARLRETADALLRGASSDSSKGGVPVRLHLSLSAIAPTEAPAATETLVEALSDREQDVLRAIASGQANKDIARTLHISLATTRNHVQHILKKLDVHTKLEAMALVTRNGWNLPADATDGRPQSPGVLAFP